MATKAVNLTNDFGKNKKTVAIWGGSVAVDNLGLIVRMITGRLMSGVGSVMVIWCLGDTLIGNERATAIRSLQSALRLKVGCSTFDLFLPKKWR